jgi:transglutaminase-like putative cysteine protease
LVCRKVQLIAGRYVTVPENLADIGVAVPHFLLMRDPRVVPVADRMWEKAGGDQDKMIDIVFDFITTHIYYITDEEAWNSAEHMTMPAEALQLGYGDCGNSAQLMESLLYFKGVPSRMVFGYAMGQSHRWVEAFYKGKWMVFDTTNGDVFPTAEREKKGYDALFFVTPYSFALAKMQFVPPLFLP